jgi:hypothetical protein
VSGVGRVLFVPGAFEVALTTPNDGGRLGALSAEAISHGRPTTKHTEIQSNATWKIFYSSYSPWSGPRADKHMTTRTALLGLDALMRANA